MSRSAWHWGEPQHSPPEFPLVTGSRHAPGVSGACGRPNRSGMLRSTARAGPGVPCGAHPERVGRAPRRPAEGRLSVDAGCACGQAEAVSLWVLADPSSSSSCRPLAACQGHGGPGDLMVMRELASDMVAPCTPSSGARPRRTKSRRRSSGRSGSGAPGQSWRKHRLLGVRAARASSMWLRELDWRDGMGNRYGEPDQETEARWRKRRRPHTRFETPARSSVSCWGRLRRCSTRERAPLDSLGVDRGCAAWRSAPGGGSIAALNVRSGGPDGAVVVTDLDTRRRGL